MKMAHFTSKHKIYLYKEDFNEFKSILNEMTKFIIDEKGEEVVVIIISMKIMTPMNQRTISLQI